MSCSNVASEKQRQSMAGLMLESDSSVVRECNQQTSITEDIEIATRYSAQLSQLCTNHFDEHASWETADTLSVKSSSSSRPNDFTRRSGCDVEDQLMKRGRLSLPELNQVSGRTATKTPVSDDLDASPIVVSLEVIDSKRPMHDEVDDVACTWI
ncbi:hypothetical protein BS50DRAFT_636875 [Corynespora cassiicola Philippines]|uniref:Uncharacterized protein n=1 Tax=Corynespora cassiicola Philippines TaxID=1448308 RepID=A0A2T2NH94_CORCC|nr:hypothetical protein BS50DRAFT_636875 [Corynespora cassiicola Philippines]